MPALEKMIRQMLGENASAGLREACKKHGFQALWTADCDSPEGAVPFLHFCLDRQDFFVYMASQGVCEESARNAMGDTLLMACAGRLRAGLWLIGRPSADPLARNRAARISCTLPHGRSLVRS